MHMGTDPLLVPKGAPTWWATGLSLVASETRTLPAIPESAMCEGTGGNRGTELTQGRGTCF